MNYLLIIYLIFINYLWIINLQAAASAAELQSWMNRWFDDHFARCWDALRNFADCHRAKGFSGLWRPVAADWDALRPESFPGCGGLWRRTAGDWDALRNFASYLRSADAGIIRWSDHQMSDLRSSIVWLCWQVLDVQMVHAAWKMKDWENDWNEVSHARRLEGSADIGTFELFTCWANF